MRRPAAATSLAILLAFGWGAGVGLFHWRDAIPLIERIEATLADIRTIFRGARTPPGVVTIVAIDDAMAEAEGRYPLSRSTLARIVDETARLQPKAIALDLLLVDATTEDDDLALAASLSRAPAVIAAAALFEGGRQSATPAGDLPAGVAEAERFLMPLESFSSEAGVGLVNVATDRTGVPRFVPMLISASGRLESSLALRAAALAHGTNPAFLEDGLALGPYRIRTDRGHVLPLAIYGPRGTIPTISAGALLDGGVDADLIQGRVVVIGATVAGVGDVFPTPFDPVLPGVEVMATAVAHLMGGNGLVRSEMTRLADVAISTVLPVLFVGLLVWRRRAVALAAIAVVALIVLALNVAAFSRGIWLSAALPMLAALPPLVVLGAAQLWYDRRRAQYLAGQSALLQSVQAPGLASWLASHGDFLAEPVRQDAAVLFIDLSGFTGFSERLGSSATRDVLGAFHGLVDDEVTRCRGIVTAFMGDGAMILFGLPEPAEDDAARALDCCIGLIARVRGWLDTLPDRRGLGFRIGAHHGAIVASRLGGQSQKHITATGDTVNVASRLMEVADDNDAELAVSDDLLIAAGRPSFKEGGFIGPVETTIRGREGRLQVWLWRDFAP